jgi:hypothetical protein
MDAIARIKGDDFISRFLRFDIVNLYIPPLVSTPFPREGFPLKHKWTY